LVISVNCLPAVIYYSNGSVGKCKCYHGCIDIASLTDSWINESLYPHIQWSRDYRTDSGGAGEWRGLCGSHYQKEVLVDAKVYTYVVGMKYPMPGICGGNNGAPNEMIIRYGSDDPFRVAHTADWVPMQAGEGSAW
jgi:N-methylhydantoinase B